VSTFTKRNVDGAEKQRADRAAIAAALVANRERADEVTRQAQPQRPALSSEEQESAAKARVAAAQAAREQRNAAVQVFLDLKQAALHLAGQAEAERNQALTAGDVERAIACQMRLVAAGALPALIDEDIHRRFPPVGLHF
jgi:hypothetical protein